MEESCSTADRFAIHDLVCRFQQAFDDRDWPAMRACLAERVFVDYSSFRAVPGGEITGDRYVAQREAALSALDMQHNFLNLRVSVDGDRAHGRCNYAIHRFHPDFPARAGGFFHSYGHYVFGFVRGADGWRIDRIEQHLLRNHGDPEIHGATRSAGNTRHA